MPTTLAREDYNAYMRQYMLALYHERRVESFEMLGGHCVVCGSTEGLEVDHIDRTTKTIELGKLWSCARKRYLAELELCQLLCEPHHREKSAREMSVEHGEGLTGKRNCRCDLCRPLKNAYARRKKAERRGALVKR
ncbi:hypothetical protein [Mycolicibacterium sphagni]|uniref:hypothetical protein n=1 Tax=Mycolicibacterium sphagni TaxID=1786 RepID=UPI0021F2C736|nr:hypothetical protein [Mycolicibacterium sphagni]MCV7174796.1 hypothetical protein [Mycolicibacterium sphagni]